MVMLWLVVWMHVFHWSVCMDSMTWWCCSSLVPSPYFGMGIGTGYEASAVSVVMWLPLYSYSITMSCFYYTVTHALVFNVQYWKSYCLQMYNTCEVRHIFTKRCPCVCYSYSRWSVMHGMCTWSSCTVLIVAQLFLHLPNCAAIWYSLAWSSACEWLIYSTSGCDQLIPTLLHDQFYTHTHASCICTIITAHTADSTLQNGDERSYELSKQTETQCYHSLATVSCVHYNCSLYLSLCDSHRDEC